MVINELQPLRDETDKNKSSNIGGWGNLLEYCKSDVFKYSFQTNKFIIIQIDTDICEEYGISKKENAQDLEPLALIEKVKEKFISIIGNDFYKKVDNRIIFAISVHSLECWLLPIYYTDIKKAKLVNCLDTLNQKLAKIGFTIDKNSKNPDYYEDISKIFSKNKDFKKLYKHNPSLKIFIENLENMNIEL